MKTGEPVPKAYATATTSLRGQNIGPPHQCDGRPDLRVLHRTEPWAPRNAPMRRGVASSPAVACRKAPIVTACLPRRQQNVGIQALPTGAGADSFRSSASVAASQKFPARSATIRRFDEV